AAVTTTVVTVTAPDGSNLWFALQAVDAYGNRSPIVRTGGYRIDTVPPDGAAATVEVRRSNYGPYAVGPALTARWAGFSDALSGVGGYYFFQQAGTGITPPQFSLTTQTVTTAAMLDDTNHFMVFAVDRAGNASSIAMDSVWVLDPTGDVDGDNFTTADEELAGTDASDDGSVFRVGIVGAITNDASIAVGLTWNSLPGRRYTVLYSGQLAPAAWTPLAGLVDLPGVGAVVTNYVETANPSYFRLTVRPE
ncbi:MAG: hypothetical protein PHR35_01235, partial [Kiritimatiellae bacterium]|nr:hypothetical protein [Kiritimatiellia bacterium]